MVAPCTHVMWLELGGRACGAAPASVALECGAGGLACLLALGFQRRHQAPWRGGAALSVTPGERSVAWGAVIYPKRPSTKHT
jgi:hypothetical protein